MGDLVLGVAKTVVEGTLVRARSAIHDEAKLKQSVQHDLVFISDEFQMMRCFLNITDEERAKNAVVKTWVRQIRDLAYDVEDCIEFVVHLDNKTAWWWRVVPSCCMAPLLPLDQAVDNITELKARVQDVSQRNMRYNLINDSGSKPVVALQHPVIAGAAEFDMLAEAKDAAKKQPGLWNLAELINRQDRDLQVISLWGTGGDFGMTSIVRKAYVDPDICRNFTWRAWVKITHPFNPDEFIRSFFAPLHARSRQEQQPILGVDALSEHRYLVVLEGLSSMVDWDAARTYLPDTNNGSRIIVSTQQFEIASLCTGHPYQISEIRQFSPDHSVCILFKEGSHRDGDKDGDNCHDEVGYWEIFQDQFQFLDMWEQGSQRDGDTYQDEMGPENFHSFESEEAQILDMLKRVDSEIRGNNNNSLAFQVMSVWGSPGGGKSALVSRIYHGQMEPKYSHRWGKYAWVDVPHPFSLKDFCRRLHRELCSITTEAEETESLSEFWGLPSSERACQLILRQHRCLFVISGLESMDEWDLINKALELKAGLLWEAKGSTIVVTNEASLAIHCADNDSLVCNVKTSDHDVAHHLFKDQEVPEQEEEEKEADQQALDEDMKDAEPEEEEGEADPAPPTARFGMADVLAKFEVAQAEEAAEQQAILDSIHLEAEVESGEEPELWAAANDQEAGPSGTAGREGSQRNRGRFTRMDKFHLVGRRSDAAHILNHLGSWCDDSHEVILSVWGVAGVGKSALVRTIYFGEMKPTHSHRSSKYGWVNVPCPFNLREFSRRLLVDLSSMSTNGKASEYFGMSSIEDPIKDCRDILHAHRCLIVIDDLQSIEDWDLIKTALGLGLAKIRAIVITNEASVAIHCADSEFVCNVKSLESDAALELFKYQLVDCTSEVRSRVMEQQVELTLAKCGGLPKVILAVRRYMATSKDARLVSAGLADNAALLWKLNRAFIPELESSCYGLKDLFVWMHSYFRSCPDYLKPCVFYLPIFSPNYNIRRRRLLRRWIAEGYSRDTVNATAEEKGEKSFEKLVELSMIQQQSSATKMDYTNKTLCSVNGFFREYILSQPMEDNMVFALEERCSQNSQYTGRHLVIRSSWDRNRYVFESIDFSRLRSLTVFGEWKSFFISEKMKVLRVLDLEDTSEVTDDDIEQIVKLLSRLKFLSLRGITSVSRLPTSLGNLKQLETLDVRHTSVTMLPPTIINLQKLQYIRAGTTAARAEEPSAQERSEGCWLPKFRRRRFISSRLGVKVPRGIGKLMALHTLGVVNVGAKGGHAILKELKNLTQVRKLGVSGVNRENVQDFYNAILAQGHLESLSVRLDEDSQDFFCCQDDISEPLKENLRSLKLYGHVCKLPAWIKQFSFLRKLDLELTILTQEVIDFLAYTRYPERLRLCVKPIQDDELNISFRIQSGGYFTGVHIVEIDCSSRLQLAFEEGTLFSFRLLKVRCSGGSQISGLAHLRELKKVCIVGSCDVALKEDLERQLAEHPSEDKPVLVPEEDVSSC